ncbi:hypothetical protein E3983_02465 [Legionella israelensis]|uniref:SecA family profile domain-containing protein n=1 Tax=Legionella israelensis TaxID=454 RepID=A0AAX1EE41_9GAMM|nr:hypothetical protein [Legionella israelensis]QBR83324.1 hypothetical protein E3983_02465 [Legionella israelensis]
MPHPYENRFPNLYAQYKNHHENIGTILEVLDTKCKHLFNLEELEQAVVADGWRGSYVDFFEHCIRNSGDGFDHSEVSETLLPYIHRTMNTMEWSGKDYTVPTGCTHEIGFKEKLKARKLLPNLDDNEVLKNYAFGPVDMARTAWAGKIHSPHHGHLPAPQVIELDHIEFIRDQLPKDEAMYIRSSKGDNKGLSQWILLYYKEGKPYVYSESPIAEDDKLKIFSLLDEEPTLEGGTSALSMSSGMRACAQYAQEIVKGAALSTSADYFSLLVEWSWWTATQPPRVPEFNWQYFKDNVLRYFPNKAPSEQFRFLDFQTAKQPLEEEKVNEHLQMRSYHLGLDRALFDEKLQILKTDPKTHTVTLTVPKIDHESYRRINEVYAPYGKAVFWGDQLHEDHAKQKIYAGPSSYANVATLFVLNTFRACAKEKNLIVDLPPEYQLDAQERNLVTYLMERNPFVCRFENFSHNKSLEIINENLQHIFARNRWLSINGYLPPLLDEFWNVSAEYWVAYLKQSPDLLSDKQDVLEFKGCVREMGLHGLEPLLKYLSNKEGELKPEFNKLLRKTDNPPVFYAGCPAKEVRGYTRALVQHLQQEKYFPFKQFQFSFVPGATREIADLLEQLNELNYFDKISLTDCTAPEHIDALGDFLLEVIHRAERNDHWSCPIHIPELEKPSSNPQLAKIYDLYSDLNNTLVKRARQKNDKDLLKINQFKVASQVVAEEIEDHEKEVPIKGKKGLESDALVRKFGKECDKTLGKQPLSLTRAGGIALQMQQQQQIKQERSRSLENEMEKGTAYEDVLPPLLIDYTNIHDELGKYYHELNFDYPIDVSKASLGTDNEKILQSFFHTWVNANPEVPAKHIIQKMTPYAAQMLLKYHRQLSGGLNVSNLPRGFYTQRLVSGELVLGYKPTLGYTTDHNPLTLELTTSIPKVERILGDYRQFNKVDEVPHLEGLLQQMQLLAEMQPELPKEERRLRLEALMQGKKLSKPWQLFLKEEENRTWAINNWELFYSGFRSSINEREIIQWFTAHPKKLSKERAIGLLIQNIYTSKDQEVQKERIFDLLNRNEGFIHVKGLGQIYSRYGNYGLERFSNLLLTIEDRLGKDFLAAFGENYLYYCSTYSPLLQESSLNTFDTILAELSRDESGQKELFLQFLDMQMQAAGWEDISILWKGFNYFYSRIKDMGLEKELTPELLRSLKPEGQNLFPCFERILKSLENIPSLELQIQFMKALPHSDLTEGGVPYAVCHEGFVLVDKSLRLVEFKNGSPTYSPPMDKLFTDHWQEPLHTNRALASKSHIKPEDYRILSESNLSKVALIWASHTEWPDAQQLLDFFTTGKNQPILGDVAEHFYHIFYVTHQAYRRFPLEIFGLLGDHAAKLKDILNKYPNNTTFFECLNILPEDVREKNLERIFTLFENAPKQHKHLEQGLLLATVYGVSEAELNTFFEATKTVKRVTSNELLILSNQLLSLDEDTLPDDPGTRKDIWQAILDGIQQMDAHPLEIAEKRKQLMQQLKETHGLSFKSSIAGDYRMVKEGDLNDLGLDKFFKEHHRRLSNFFTSHIAVSEAQLANQPLKPIVEFFKRLQLNKTYINEVEPLLSTLEKVLEKHDKGAWASSYFDGLLHNLQPQDSTSSFPISILEAILTEPDSPFIPGTIDEVQPDFDKEGKWKSVFGLILSKAETFDRVQQANLARLAIRTIEEPGFITSLVTSLTHKDYDGLREVILARLLSSKKPPEQFDSIFKQCTDLIRLDHDPISNEDWKATSQLWIETLTKYPELEEQFALEKIDADKKAMILHIAAWSSFSSNQYPTVPRGDYLKGDHPKAVKLVTRLSKLSKEELNALAQNYPGKPAPDTRNLLTFIKNKESRPLDKALGDFLTKEQSTFRQDYQRLSSTREADLARMLELTYVNRGKEVKPLDAQSGVQLTLMFQYLKQLEQGVSKITGYEKPIGEMTEEELKAAFKKCSDNSNEDPNNMQTKTQVWAILFEVLGRTTGKYPHLAQQFALIANDLLLSEDPSSILQLKTGEGKSHFVALRAARHVGLGKKVDVCTAKWSLAERDLLDYKPFFDFLGISTANVHARSEHDTYVDAQVVYTTPGDLSLFLDEQASQGKPIPIDKANRVGLGDEFDFLYYEGQKTQFNYARHTGISPKEMAWFYRGLNEFYDNLPDEYKNNPKENPLTTKQIMECFEFLAERANEDGLLYLEGLNPMELLGWLQSTHEAATLQFGVQYTVRLEQVKVGEEEFPLREIYPLTKDMQAAVGSSFSHGVHQLLAARLNDQAALKDEPQNYHVHPESNIISSQVFSQRLKTLWGHWEGFTGTVSSSQSYELNEEHATAVLRVPTNQKDLRKWPIPQFFDNKSTEKAQEARLEKIATDIKQRIREKKSILWCCATDKEVLEMTAAIKKYFTKEEYEQYFLSYTNESHESPAEILRRKKQMEGDYLGQKERGVVLIAAGFGRGDNVGVETVILGSVQDENDLGQKGGRTARNGEEGEVLQYYITKEIDEELLAWNQFLAESGLLEDVVQELKRVNHPLRDAFNEYEDNFSKYQPNDKFNLLLRLREYSAAKDNYLSRFYHEAKAKLSSEGINKIGQAEPQKKDQLIKDFANYLTDLEKKWLEIQTHYKDKPDACIKSLRDFINEGRDRNGRLDSMFKDLGGFEIEVETPNQPKFILDTPAEARKNQLQIAVQGLILRIVDLPEDFKSWNQLITDISKMTELQMEALLNIYENTQTLQFSGLQKHVSTLIKDRNVVEQIQQLREGRKAGKLSELKFELNTQQEKILHQSLLRMDPISSNLVLEYILSPKYSGKEYVEQILPMLQYSAANPDLSISFWNNPIIRDSLLTLPASCFTETVYLEADHLLAIKNFLDRYVDVNKSEKEYSELFNQFVRGMRNQPEHRKRLLAQYESILERTEMLHPDLLKRFAEIGENLKAPEHFNVLKRFIEKMKKEYEAPRVPIKELDTLWDNLGNLDSRVVGLLPLIEQILATEGKEFVSRFNSIFQLEPDLIAKSQEFLKEFFPKTARIKKEVKISEYNKVLEGLQDLFSNEIHKFERTMQFFGPYLLSKDFEYASEFNGIRMLLDKVPAHIIEEKLKNYSTKDIHYLLSLVHHFPENAEDWLILVPSFVSYLDSDSYIHLSSGEKKIAIAGIQNLLQAGIVEKDGKSFDVLVSLNFAEMKELLYLSKNFPNHAHNLLAIKPLITYLSQLGDKQAQESTFKSIKRLLKNIEVTNTDLRVVRAAFTKEQPPLLGLDKLPALLQLFDNNKGHEVDILLSSLVALEPLSNVQNKMIKLFYEHQSNPSAWIQNDFMTYSTEERVALMDLLKNEYFVSRLPAHGFSVKQANDLYQAGLDAYKAHVSGVLEQKSKEQPRELSSVQQKEVLKVMDELEKIGTAPPKFKPIHEDTRPNLGKAINVQIKSYEKLWMKDKQRFNDLKDQIDELKDLVADKGKSYEELMKKVREIKVDLMMKDSEKASKQLLPRFHFRGQSRLYRTFNDIEDLILKSWTYRAHKDIELSKNFTATYDATTVRYVSAFKNALNTWNTNNNNKLGLFKDKEIGRMHQDVQNLDNDGIVQYLREHPDQVKKLPGALRAIAKEVLVHSVDDNAPHIDGPAHNN